MSVRWQHCIDQADNNIQKPGDSPDCLLGVVPQPTESRLSETTCIYMIDPYNRSAVSGVTRNIDPYRLLPCRTYLS